jgi:predicted GIY-YIG superfamily endonuclease
MSRAAAAGAPKRPRAPTPASLGAESEAKRKKPKPAAAAVAAGNDAGAAAVVAAAPNASVRLSEGYRFIGCYLLKSEASVHANRSYIGFTTDPVRRLRQHNGLLKAGGARQTARFRPWRMVCTVWGFPTKVSALQFEWAWQHANESRFLKHHSATFKRSPSLSLSLSVYCPVIRLFLLALD